VSLLDLVMALFMFASVLVVLVLVVRVAVLAALGRWSRCRGAALVLGGYGGGYLAVLVAVSLVMPRRSFAPGERECFDDWCVAGVAVRPAAAEAPCAAEPGRRVWIATVEVSSDAKRVRQRARDARAVLEDRAGRWYEPCAAPLDAHDLTDELGPGEAFTVTVPFRLPEAAAPAGVVVHHGAFPGALIIGDDQSLLHPPTLLGVAGGG